MKTCPRCHRNGLYEEEPLNALSRRDNATYICPACGDDEALIDAGYQAADDIERNFVDTLTRKEKS